MGKRRHPEIRVSDAERFDVARRVREAGAEGRLEPEEVDQRVRAAYEAKTYGDLAPLTKDLPRSRRPRRTPEVRPEPTAVVPSSIPRHERTNALLAGETRAGTWEVGAVHEVSAYLGSVTLDLRQAQFTAPETVIEANVFLGSVDIKVNKWTRVVLDGTGVAGSFTEARSRVTPEIGPDSPIVRVRGRAVMGSVEVRRRRMPGERRRKLRGR